MHILNEQMMLRGTFIRPWLAKKKEHHLVLLDYYEYLKDSAGWFVKKEHPSLDGG